jgi:hypothetical protein
MKYYVVIEDDTDEMLNSDARLLGESSFDNFYTGGAFVTLVDIIENSPELLPLVEIKSSTGKTFTISEFLSDLKNLRVIRH